MQNSDTYLKCELSCGELCVEISKFSLAWQQRSLSGTILLTQLNRLTPKTPYLVHESWW